MRGYRLSQQAEQTLEDILSWSIEYLGIQQAERYKNQLTCRLAALAAREPPHGRSCNRLLTGQRDVVDLEYYREGRHYMIYRNTFDATLVIDFVHGSRDLEAVLDELS